MKHLILILSFVAFGTISIAQDYSVVTTYKLKRTVWQQRTTTVEFIHVNYERNLIVLKGNTSTILRIINTKSYSESEGQVTKCYCVDESNNKLTIEIIDIEDKYFDQIYITLGKKTYSYDVILIQKI